MGMEQKTIGRIFFAETLIMGMFSILIGIFCGVFCSQFITAMLLTAYGKPYEKSQLDINSRIPFCWQWLFFVASFFVVGKFSIPVPFRKQKIIDMLSAEKENEPELKKEPLHFCCSSPLWSIYRMGIDDRNTKGLVLLWHPLCVSGAAYVLGKYSFSAAYFAVVDILHN